MMFQDSHVILSRFRSRTQWPQYQSTDEPPCAIHGGATAVLHTVARAPARLQTADPSQLSLRIRVPFAGKRAVLPATRHRQSGPVRDQKCRPLLREIGHPAVTVLRQQYDE